MGLCIRCNGTGKYLGNGMMMTDCTLCQEESSEAINEKKIIPKIDKKSPIYKKAIKEIMDINPNLSRQKAAQMFDKAYEKA